MRNEQEMYNLIMSIARSDERVRAVILNGSRANPNAQPDIFQDFDIVYIVTDIASFRHDLDWHKQFGESMIMQRPDEMQEPPLGDDSHYTYLMQFADGNRIDLTLYPIEKFAQYQADSLSVLLLGDLPTCFGGW